MSTELGSRSDIRSLRRLNRINYKKMSDGEAQNQQVADSKSDELGESPDVDTQGASGFSTGSGSSQPVSGQPFDAQNPFFDDFDRDQDEAEIVEIQLQMKRLNAEEARWDRKKRLEQMRQELRDQKQRIREMKGKDPSEPVPVVKSKLSASQKNSSDKGARPKTVSSGKTKAKVPVSQNDIEFVPDSDAEQVTVEDLKQNPKLQKKVQKELSKLGLKVVSLPNESSSSADNSSDSSSSDCDSSHIDSDNSKSKSKKKKLKSKKHKKSGINAKSSDKVKNPQRWPHAYLQYEYVNKQVKFDELDFKLFLAGEISIIAADDLSELEKKGRLNLLQKIIYYSNTYEFKGLKAFYAAWLREIELGKRNWSDDPQQIESAILNKYLLKNKGFSGFANKGSSNKMESGEDKTWFCSEFQRNKCKHKSSHLRVHNGKQKLASHICATCWLKDKKKLEHPECSSSCPHLAD